jgi:hypothetical protein
VKLESEMEALIGTYECEWKQVLEKKVDAAF